MSGIAFALVDATIRQTDTDPIEVMAKGSETKNVLWVRINDQRKDRALGGMQDRRKHLQRFYSILDALEITIGGTRTLAMCSGHMDWPQRGVYFFREAGEQRRDTGTGPRIVRVGTHALSATSKTRLWTRLSQHRGNQRDGGGNHRGSIFRLLVGTALMARDELECSTWGSGNSASAEVRQGETTLERRVSTVIWTMPFLWLSIDDDPGPTSLRGYIERNAIALLSNYRKPPLDPPSDDWLGLHCNRERVRASGLWNSNHVEEKYDVAFIDLLARLVSEARV
jgi:hypothetical protein